MSLRYEVWAVPWASTFERIIADLPVVDAKGLVRFNDFGEASVTLPADYGRVDEIISSTVGRMIRVYNGTTIIQEFLAERVDRNIDDETIGISGGDLATVFDKVILYPFDYPTSPSKFPDWVYGGEDDILRNTEFDVSGQTEKQQYHVHGSSGTYTITVPSFGTTAGISPYEDGGRASDVEAAIEALAGISDVSVTGRGNTQFDPIVIEFLDPLQDFSQITIDETNLVNSGCDHPPCHSALISTLRDGSFSIDPFTRCQDPISGVLSPILHGTYDSISVVDDPALGSPTKAIRVDPAQSNAGIQQTVRVTEGAPAFGSWEVYTASTSDEFFLSVVDKNERVIARGTLTTVSANTWTEVSLTGVTLPDGLLDSEVVFRVQVTAGHSEPSVFHLKNPSFVEAQAATTVGQIVTDMMDDAKSDHSGDTRGSILTWVDNSGFDGTTDSSSTAWAESLSIRFDRGMTYGQAFDKFRALGYEWRLTPKASLGATTHDLEWYNEDSLGDDYENSDTPAVSVGQSTTSGPVVQRIPDYTAVLVEGAGNAYTEDKDTTAETNFGRLEKYFGDKRWTDATTRTAVGDQALAAESDNRIAVKVSITENPKHPIPLVDYKPGDVLNFQVPPVLSRTARRVQSITWNHGETPTYDVTGSKVFPGESGGWETLRVLLRKFQTLDFEEGEQGVDVFGGGGGAPTLVVAASDASDASKAKADFVCTGVNDQDVIQAAINQFVPSSPWQGARVLLTEGTFSIHMAGQSFEGIRLDYGTIAGMGKEATILNVGDSPAAHDNPVIWLVTTRATVRDLAVSGGSTNRTTGIRSDAVDARVDNCYISTNGYAVDVYDFWTTITGVYNVSDYGIRFNTAQFGTLDDTYSGPATGDAVEVVSSSGVIVHDNVLEGAAGGVIVTGGSINRVHDNQILDVGEHGIVLDGSSDNTVSDNTVSEPGKDTDNTYDGVHLVGDSDRNYIHGNKVVPPASGNAPRYGINISVDTCDRNIVVGNGLGNPTDYGTDALNDAGTNTQLTYPSDTNYGDNFTYAGLNKLDGTLGASIEASGSLA